MHNKEVAAYNSIHPIAPVCARRIPMSLCDVNTRRYTLVHCFKLFPIGCIGLNSDHFREISLIVTRLIPDLHVAMHRSGYTKLVPDHVV